MMNEILIKRLGLVAWSIPMAITFNDNIASCGRVPDGVVLEPTLPALPPWSTDLCLVLRERFAGKYGVSRPSRFSIPSYECVLIVLSCCGLDK